MFLCIFRVTQDDPANVVDFCLPQSDVITRWVSSANVVYEFRESVDLREVIQGHEVGPVGVPVIVIPDVFVAPADESG